MAFVHKSVNPTGRIGRDLTELRERAGFTRAAIAERTKIADSLIRAWEEEAWEGIDDVVYTERILRAYVAYLGGSVSYFLQKYREGLRAHSFERRAEELLPRTRKIRRWDLTVVSRLITWAAFSLFVVGLGLYVYTQVRAISAPPPLVVSEPEDGLRVEVPAVRVRGKTLPESSVTVNGRSAFIEPDGSFTLNLDIARGTTVLLISAKKRHSHDVTITRRVVYDRPLPTIEAGDASATAFKNVSK